MSSNITDAPPDKLINLIYHHLKENGYKKAASALKKHAPEVATKKVKVSLSEIFQKWASSDDGGVQTAAKTQRGSSTGITAPSAGSASKSAKLKKKETGMKPRRRKKSTSEDVGVPPPVAAPGNDSNSDSSLDVEKWKNFLSQLSDADQAKMDALSVLDESLVIGKPAAKRTRKPRTSKKEDNQAKGKSNTPAKKTGAKSDDVPVAADASKTHSKKPKGKDAGVPEVKTPPKKTQNKKDRSISDLDVAEAPKRTKAKTTHNSIDQRETDKEEHHETNGLLETGTPSTRTKETGVSDSEAIRTPKRVHFETHDSFSLQVETPNTWKDDGTSETRSIDTPSKKVKKKKAHSEAGDVQTDDCPSNNIQEVIETNLTMDQSEMPSKKAKSKKSKSVVEPIPNETPSKKVKAKKTEGPSEIDQETTSEKAPESVNPESSAKKAKRKANESLSETVEFETPSKKAKDVEKPSEVETPGKKSQKVNDLQSDSTSKKRKGTVAADGVEIQRDVPSETPEKTSQSQAQTKDDVGDGLGNEDTSSQELKTPPKKIKKHKREEACDVPAMPEAKKPKKDKVKDKDKEGENGGDTLQPPPPLEEEAASVAITQKKKKKKKEKEREGETVQDDPPEVAVHKKKKKSSKEKPLGSDEGLNST